MVHFPLWQVVNSPKKRIQATERMDTSKSIRFFVPIFINQEVTKMTIYQEEIQRKAQHYGCTTEYNQEDQLLCIGYKDLYITGVTAEGYMHYISKDLADTDTKEIFTRLTEDAEVVREYVGLYESAPKMKPKDVQNYRKFSEYGDVVFAGMYSQKHGFMFCSWRQSNNGNYLAHGDYSPDYLSSKENYAVRAGLVNKDKLFTAEEAKELYKLNRRRPSRSTILLPFLSRTANASVGSVSTALR